MRRKYVALCTLAVALAALPAGTQAQDAKTVVSAVVKAMGADMLKTIQLSGSGSIAGIGQNINPNTAWPIVRVKSYTRQIDLDAGASNVQMVRVQNNADQPQQQVIPANAPWLAQSDFWVTPYGFLKGALVNNSTVRTDTLRGAKYTVLTYMLQSKYKVEGYINDRNLVERVRTWVDNDVLGDTLVEGVYTEYQDFGGVKVPTFLIVTEGGFPILVLTVNEAKANVPVVIPPEQPPTAPAPVTVQTEKIAEGVYYLKGGTHHSVAVEFADHVVLVEAPLNEERMLAVLAEVKKLIPTKPIRYVVNTHHHFDHSGGLRTAVDAGIAIVTDASNKAFYERVLTNPRTINPDRLEQSKKKPVIEVVTGGKKVMSDATRTLELYLIKNNAHNEGILMGYLPKEKILIEVDMYTPPAAGSPAPAAAARANPTLLITDLEALRLDFDTILPLHGPGKVPRSDLYAFINKPVTDLAKLPEPAPAGGGRGGRNGVTGAAAGPDGPIITVMNSACAACHNLERITQKRGDQDDWTGTVTRMKAKGAVLTDEQVPLLIDYLTRTYGL